jgi:hypothetical protein
MPNPDDLGGMFPFSASGLAAEGGSPSPPADAYGVRVDGLVASSTTGPTSAGDDYGLPYVAPATAAPPDLLQVYVNVAYTPGGSEDARPMLTQVPGAPGVWLLAVCDGLGGAGARTYPTENGPRSGAFLAARLARRTVAEWAKALPDLPALVFHRVPLAERLEAHLRHAFTTYSLPDEGSRIRGTLQRTLPTTLVVAVVLPEHAVAWVCWAGDSRAYLLDSQYGLSQLTVDDLRSGGDALANLTGDSAISNCVAADGRFTLRESYLSLPERSLIFTATDGCFGYVPSPAHFEYVLLRSIRDARGKDENGWSEQLDAGIRMYAADDATLAGLAVGWSSVAHMAEELEGRFQYLTSGFVHPLDDRNARARELDRALKETVQERDELRARLWATYRTSYERLIHRPAERLP